MSKGTVLLVGCAPQNAAALSQFFESRGYQIRTTGADREAFRICMTNRFDILVTDFAENGDGAALLIESVTMVSPNVNIAAVEPENGFKDEAPVRLALTKTYVRVRPPLADITMEPLLGTSAAD